LTAINELDNPGLAQAKLSGGGSAGTSQKNSKIGACGANTTFPFIISPMLHLFENEVIMLKTNFCDDDKVHGKEEAWLDTKI